MLVFFYILQNNMNHSESRYEDMWSWILKVSETEDKIEIETIPPMESVTFTWSWWQSDNTYKALKKLFCSIRKDNEEFPQKNNLDQPSYQSRTTDWWIFKFWHQNELIVSSYADVKLTVNSVKGISFKSPNTWWISKNTYETAKELIIAMQKDNEEKPQNK